MKKLLGIVVLGLLLSGNAYAEKITWNCTGWKNIKWINWQLDSKINELSSQWQSRDGKNHDQIARIISSGDDYVIVQDYIKSKKKWNSTSWKFNYSGDISTEYKGETIYYGDCKKTSLVAEKPKKKKPKQLPEDNKVVPAGSGSGFFVSNEGHVITNHHVIEGCNTTKVSFKGNQVDAQILAVDKMNDIAILKTNIKPDSIFPISNEDVSLLEDVVVAGYPLGKQVSSAIKTHKGVVTALAGAGDNYSNFQTDASINAGNSGGPIMNQKGNIVGIAVATWVQDGVQGVHFGIKSSTLKTFASSNSLKFSQANNRELSNKDLGKLITEATVYLECHMTVAKIKRMIAEANNQKAFFSEFK